MIIINKFIMIVFVYGTKSNILYKENMMGSRLEG